MAKAKAKSKEQQVGDKVTYVNAAGETFSAKIVSLSTPARSPGRGNVSGLRLIVNLNGREVAVDAVKNEGEDRAPNEGFYR